MSGFSASPLLSHCFDCRFNGLTVGSEPESHGHNVVITHLTKVSPEHRLQSVRQIISAASFLSGIVKSDLDHLVPTGIKFDFQLDVPVYGFPRNLLRARANSLYR